MSFDLDLLPTFAVFASTRSFTETGRRRGLTQPAVHGQVKRLSEQIGAPLYERRGRALVLTRRGEALAALARDVDRMKRAFLDEPPAPRLAAGRGAWTHLLLPRLPEVVRQLRPIVADGVRAQLLVDQGHAELGVTVALPEGPHRTLFEVGSHVLVPATDPRTGPVRFADLAHDRWIVPSPGRPHRVILEGHCRRAGFDPAIALTCDDWEVTAGFVALGLGIAVVNDFVSHPGTRALPLVDAPIQRYRLFWREGACPVVPGLTDGQ